MINGVTSLHGEEKGSAIALVRRADTPPQTRVITRRNLYLAGRPATAYQALVVMDGDMTKLLKTSEVTERIQMTTKTLRRWRMAGEGPPWVQLGRTVRYPADKLEAWLAARTVGAAS